LITLRQKYDSLSEEDKKAVDAFRNQEYDVDVQTREGGSYGDVITRDGAQLANTPATGTTDERREAAKNPASRKASK
jgi:hypothetical protein